jgi:hypothetical protein
MLVVGCGQHSVAVIEVSEWAEVVLEADSEGVKVLFTVLQAESHIRKYGGALIGMLIDEVIPLSTIQ